MIDITPRHLQEWRCNTFPLTSCLSRPPMDCPAQYPSTTPEASPDKEYHDSILKRREVSTDLNQGTQHPNMEGQLPDHESRQGDARDSIAATSAIMALARKSIMLNASASPESLFRKLTSDKTIAASTNARGPNPSKVFQQANAQPEQDATTLSGTKLESTIRTAAATEETLALPASTTRSTACPPSEARVASEPNLIPAALRFHGILDLSQPAKPVIPKSKIRSNTAPLNIVQSRRQVDEYQQQLADNNTSIAHPKEALSGPDRQSDTDSEMQLADATDVRLLIPFDLRSTLRQVSINDMTVINVSI